MDLVSGAASHLGLIVFSVVSFALVAYLVYWMVHPEGF